MPRKPPPDLSDAIDAILRDATERILTLVAEQQDRWLDTLEHQLVTAETTLRERRRLAQSVRQAVQEAAPSAARHKTAPARIRTEDVMTDLREVIAANRQGLRIAELRELTGYGDMQLHRALRRLQDDGEISKVGPQRKSVYRPTRRLRGRRSSSRVQGGTPPSSPSRRTRKATRRSPRTQWVSTDDVKNAVVKALRNRRKGLSMPELCELTGYTDKQIHRAISVLVDAQRLRKTGSHRSMRYLLKRTR